MVDCMKVGSMMVGCMMVGSMIPDCMMVCSMRKIHGKKMIHDMRDGCMSSCHCHGICSVEP